MRTKILSMALFFGSLIASAQTATEDDKDIVQSFNSTIFQDTIPAIIKPFRKPSQGGFVLSGGIGAPECINFKIRYGGQFQAGVSAGCLPGYTISGRETSLSVDLDFYLNFARSKKTDQFIWYFNSGISKIYPESVYDFSTTTTTDHIIYTRLGRSFNFNRRTGINLDLGIMLSHVSETAYYSPMYTASHGHPVLKYNYDGYDPYPAVSFSFFVRL